MRENQPAASFSHLLTSNSTAWLTTLLPKSRGLAISYSITWAPTLPFHDTLFRFCASTRAPMSIGSQGGIRPTRYGTRAISRRTRTKQSECFGFRRWSFFARSNWNFDVEYHFASTERIFRWCIVHGIHCSDIVEMVQQEGCNVLLWKRKLFYGKDGRTIEILFDLDENILAKRSETKIKSEIRV